MFTTNVNASTTSSTGSGQISFDEIEFQELSIDH